MFFRCPAFAFSAAVGVVFGFAPAPNLIQSTLCVSSEPHGNKTKT
jgi:hypothetical protein